MRPPRSLRARLAGATALVVLLAVGAAGVAIAWQIDARDRAEVDLALTERANRIAADLDKLLGSNEPAETSDSYGELLDGTASLVRVLDGDHVLVQRGAQLGHDAIPTPNGLATLTLAGTNWRSLTVPGGGSLRVQALQSLAPVEARRTANTALVGVVTAATALLAGGLAWLLAGRLVRPLEILSAGATAIAQDPDTTHRLPRIEGPTEASALADALNTMLERLDTSIAATRRFTADVGHEVRGPLAAMAPYLEALSATSDPDQAHAARAASTQHRRLTALIEGLQTLARGDAGALPATEEIEFGTLVGELVRQARSQHPNTAFTLEDASAGAAVRGWRDGLRIAAWNLLDNAAVHGRPGGNVQVSVDADDGWIKVTVADIGPGIPADQRGAMLERFRRGPTPRVPGSGLGLSLVEQQARLHHGTLTLADSSLGGLAATLQLPRTSPAEDS